VVAHEQRRASGSLIALAVATGVIALVGLVLTIISWPFLSPADAYPLIAGPVAAAIYVALGSLIVRRAANPIGWILAGVGAGIALLGATSAYAVAAISGGLGLRAPTIVGAASEWIFVPIVFAMAFMLLQFPTGTLPSRRWRLVAVPGTAAVVVITLAWIVTPRLVELPAPGGVSLTFPNPLGIESFPRDPVGTIGDLTVASVVLFAVAAASLVVRYRSGEPDLRQQIKWLALVGGAFVVSQLALAISFAIAGNDAVVTTVIGLTSAVLALFGFPVAITVAILRYGLFEIDVIINRAVVYALLAAVLTAIYVAIVAGLGALAGYAWGPTLTIAAAVSVAVLFQPLRRRAQTVANRLVYGDRATPYQVLSEFADAMARILPLEEQLDRVVTLLASGTGADAVDVWMRVGARLRAVAVWPAGSAVPDAVDDDERFPDATATFPVLQGDELLGVIVLRKPRNEPLSATESSLADHVASQAGLVLRNVGLTAELRLTIDELRASRRRLVEAQDSERRKIERNLHDGAQQQLVALGVQLSLLERIAQGTPGAKPVGAAMPSLQQALQSALDDLRDLARGIYPPLLADRGLSAALEAQARKAAVPTTVEADGVGRYDQQVEATVYFCTLEALQNVAKYAGATTAVVRLAHADGSLSFEIADDGRGFDPAAASGSGLQGMADRLDAIGGTFAVESSRGGGTVVRGSIAAAPIEAPIDQSAP
jgi:signal transduction histidine kinase